MKLSSETSFFNLPDVVISNEQLINIIFLHCILYVVIINFNYIFNIYVNKTVVLTNNYLKKIFIYTQTLKHYNPSCLKSKSDYFFTSRL